MTVTKTGKLDWLLLVLRVLAVAALVLSPVLFALAADAPVAYADDGNPPGGGDADPDDGNNGGGNDGGGGGPISCSDDDPANCIQNVFFSLAEKVITIVIMVSVAILGVSLAFGTSGAQIANMIGSPIAVSQSWMRVLTAVFTFLMVLLVPVFVHMIFGMVSGLFSGSVNLPRW